MNLTEAEIELIRLKRIEEENKQQQKLINERLVYEKLLKQQQDYIQKEKIRITNENQRIQIYCKNLIVEGCGDYVELKNSTREIKYSDHYPIKPEDKIIEEINTLYIETQWGNIYSVDINNKTTIPYQLSSGYRSYTAKGCATKIKETIQLIKAKQETREQLIKAKEYLIKQFKTQSPTGTEFITSEESYSDGYGKFNYSGVKYFITINYPNKSWVKIEYYKNNEWVIRNKFDSKYIQPETKEEWLEYLAK